MSQVSEKRREYTRTYSRDRYRNDIVYREKHKLQQRCRPSARLGNIKHDAAARGVAIAVSDETLLALLHGSCVYCGAAPAPLNGVDRVNNERGYTEDNIVSCCKICNVAKNDKPVADFLSWVKRVYKHQVRLA